MDNKDIPITTKAVGSIFQKFAVLTIVSIGFIAAFAGGYFVKVPIQQPVEVQNKYLLGKRYFEDTVIAVSEQKPYYTIAATVTRLERDGSFAQRGRVAYFDGTKWDRKSEEKTTNSPTIISNSLIGSWLTDIDSSRVLKENSQGNINFGNTNIAFSTGALQNEIGIRSLPGYTKFISVGKGVLTIDQKQYPSHIIYTRIYSLDSSQIQFYNQPFGLTTDWLVFWDEEGNFYHIDRTDVTNPTQIYQTHQLGIMEDKDSSVSKTFQVSSIRNSVTSPDKYTFTLGSPIDVALNIERFDMVNKAPDNSYNWFMGHVTGSVKDKSGKLINGMGIIEYIHN